MMNQRWKQTRSGLILLVVLGMLALFSLLAVTYVLFSGQSRAASVALARSEIRDTRSNWKPSFEEAIMQLVRGTTDAKSSIYGHGLLDDLYGFYESQGVIESEARDFQFDQSAGGNLVPMNYIAASNNQRPVLIGGDFTTQSSPPESAYTIGHFLRVPLNPSSLPIENDALTGRIVTFTSGPLQGQSFRVVRYIGAIDLSAPAAAYAQRYSITIDLTEADLSQLHSQSIRDVDGELRTVTMTLFDWMRLKPGVPNNAWTEGIYLCYQSVGGDPANRTLDDGYQLYFNATSLNTHGAGVYNNGASQMHFLQNPATTSLNSNVNAMAAGLQTRLQDLADSTRFHGLDPTLPSPSADKINGDTDEPYDAPDFNNFFLSHRYAAASHSQDIIPSFHRAALINYIVNWKSPAQYTEPEFYATLERIKLAVARPLSINIQTPSSQIVNGQFTGSSSPQATPFPSAPTLAFQLSNWNDWPTVGYPEFVRWVNFLTLGPWDVDNDGDGVLDSVWVDIGLPLQSSPDGKLLKTLVAYYVDDLDKRLDVNATGNSPQANLAGITYAAPTPTGIVPSENINTSKFAKGNNAYLPQGIGYGSAETSFRHLLGKSGLFLNGMTADEAYAMVMYARYRRNPFVTEYTPGDIGDDARSYLGLRERNAVFQHTRLPGLPVGVNGRISYALDRLGNVSIWNFDRNSTFNESLNDPYESRLTTDRHQDSPFTMAEWERIYRIADSDRMNLPSRLQSLMGETDSTLTQSNLRHEITAISRHLRQDPLATRSHRRDITSPSSFYTLVNTVYALKTNSTIVPQPTAISSSEFQQLFPLEFSHGTAMNLNRPFGDGRDNDIFENRGEIDEPMELINYPQTAGYVDGNGNESFEINEDYLNGVSGLDPGYETRQLFARHLYCMAQLIVPSDYVFPNVDRDYFQTLLETAGQLDPDPANPDPVLVAARSAARTKIRAIRGRTLAQWAVNVVDFRDSDASMTRFPYDEDPYTNALGNTQHAWDLTDGGHVVWGLEQPELLLTESLAMHDLRIKKHPTEDQFIQYRTPEGSLFLELYCPRTTGMALVSDVASGADLMSDAGVPTSLYSGIITNDPNDSSIKRVEPALELSRLAPGGFPVWRVYISGPGKQDGDKPDTPLEKLLEPVAGGSNKLLRNDVTYQLPSSNSTPTLNRDQVKVQSGLVLDLSEDVADRLPDPQETESRVIIFTPTGTPIPGGGTYTPTVANTPGIRNTYQIYYNQVSSPSDGLHLRGNQYLVVGPRETTYFGSRNDASVPANDNAPNRQRIELNPRWVDTFKLDGDPARDSGATDFELKDVVSIIAGAELNWPAPSDPDYAVKDYVGVNVSEPDPIWNANPLISKYYNAPDVPLNSTDTDEDTVTGAPGFGEAEMLARVDAYHDYGTAGVVPTIPAPLDNGTRAPLKAWDLDADGNPNVLTSADNVLQPGTIQDWSTAYLQRLADPARIWDARLNPYITVDWIPIDLTLFSGDEDDPALAPPATDKGAIRLASRQKTGQLISATDLEFDAATGLTFFSLSTSTPEESTKLTTSQNYLEYEVKFDSGQVRPAPADGNNNFITLGFLNSHFVLQSESTLTTPSYPLPRRSPNSPPFMRDSTTTEAPALLGGPGDPAKSNPNWHPHTLFWANREFINPLELAYVPLSSAGQLMQEFSGTVSAKSIYAASYVAPNISGQPQDPRMPNAAFPRPIPNDNRGDGYFVPDNQWPPGPRWPGPASRPTSPSITISNTVAQYPYTHLLNFFQEVSELPFPNPELNSPARFNEVHPKNPSLGLLMDMTDTPSPWVDAKTMVRPTRLGFRDVTSYSNALQAVLHANNQVMATYRAPYNGISRFVEPGRVNLNTMAEQNVLHGLWSNTLPPTDRQSPATSTSVVGKAWESLHNSRRGYSPISGFYNPGAPVYGVTRFNPHFPTEFAATFKPSSEAGMVPVTRQIIPSPTTDAERLLSRLTETGVLDIYSRKAPAHTSLMRGSALTPVSTPESTYGLAPPSGSPLIYDSTASNQRHIFTDAYPMTRLANLTTDRSNTFAVYVTLGLFEYDPSTGIGVEYGSDRGESERAKAFYVIDRTVPVGYRPGQNENAGKTILVRRYLTE